eukprot:SAG31_NODE_15920_length_730_cov_2.666139_1_plen_167_part_10
MYDHLRAKKSAAYHEVGTLAPVLSYQWDAIFFFEDWLPELKRLCQSNADAILALDALLNSLKGTYGILNRRRNLLELRAKVESDSPSLQPTEFDKKLFETLSAKIGGFERDYGLDGDIDPLFKKILQDFQADAHSAKLKSLAKSAGAAPARGNNKGPSPKRAPKKGG